MIKTLAKYIKEYKRDTVVTPILMIAEAVLDMLIPFFMASIIDLGINAGDMDKVIFYGVMMLLMAGCGVVTGMLGSRYGARASAGFAKNLRKGMFESIQNYSFANIDKFSTSSLVTRMTTDVTNVQMAFMMIIRMAIRAPIIMISAMVLSYQISPRLATIFLIAIIVLGAILFLLMRAAVKHFRRVFPKYDDLNKSIQENVNGIRVVKAYVKEGYETEKEKKASGNIYKLLVKAEKILVVLMPVAQITVYVCILLISWIGAHMIVSDTLTTGQLMSLITYCLNILIALIMLAMVFVMITMSSASAERISEVLNEKPDLQNPEDPIYDVADGSIVFKDVYFKYHETSESPILKDIDLVIPSGSVIGIMGGTGSGKTSLVNLISRLYDVSGGEVIVGGHNVKEYDMEALRNQVAVVLQKNVLFSGSILENLRWGDPNATLEDCQKACALACADEFIEQMPDKYDTHIEQGGTNVSGGQKQRLCIARALLKKPKILILDDSTSAVDTATDAKIREAMKNEIPDITKIIIAQRISSIQHADQIIVMDDGKIDAIGTHEELAKNNEIYKEIYESQLRGSGDFDEKKGGEM